MSSHAQESARRIGICLNDAELFWWRADDDEPCPVCSVGDDDYDERHRFYCAEAENQHLRREVEHLRSLLAKRDEAVVEE